jgi:Dimerisation and cyclophilin-binding domain of Mon2
MNMWADRQSATDEFARQALLICFRLQDSKVVVVNNTAAATLRQLVIHVFDKVAKEDAILAKGKEHHGTKLALKCLDTNGLLSKLTFTNYSRSSA